MEIHGTPTQTQLKHLKELVLQHRKILISNADDEPLKQRLWSLIAEELNSIDEGPLLEPQDWKAFINLEEYRSKRGRKAYKTNDEAAIICQKEQPTAPHKRIKLEEQANDDAHSEMLNELSIDEDTTNDEINELLTSDDELEADDLESLLNSMDSDSNTENDEILHEFAHAKNVINLKTQLKSTPLVKNFKFSKRMLENVDQLNTEVNNIKEQMKNTTTTLQNIEQLLHKQCQQQAETNALIKRNCQLTKLLVEYKVGRRARKMKELN